MITRATLSTIEQGLPKYRSMLAGNTAYQPSGYFLLATATPSATSTVTISSIPQTYRHLEIIGQYTDENQNGLTMRFNGDSSSNYSTHAITARTADVVDSGAASSVRIWAGTWNYGATGSTSQFAALTIKIPDYASTTKLKTALCFSGWAGDSGANPNIEMGSGMRLSTQAINSITFVMPFNFVSGTMFSVYGVY